MAAYCCCDTPIWKPLSLEHVCPELSVKEKSLCVANLSFLV